MYSGGAITKSMTPYNGVHLLLIICIGPYNYCALLDISPEVPLKLKNKNKYIYCI